MISVLLLISTIFSETNKKLTILKFQDLTIAKQSNRAVGHRDIDLGEILVQSLYYRLQTDYILIERSVLDSILSERKILEEGDVSKGNVIKIGKLTGAHYLLIGAITDFYSKANVYKGYGMNIESEVYSLSVTYRLIDVFTGEIVQVGQQTSVTDTGKNKQSGGQLLNIEQLLCNDIVKEIQVNMKKFFKDKRDAGGK